MTTTPRLAPRRTVRIDRARVDSFSMAGCVAAIVEACGEGRGGSVVTVNLDHLVRMRRDPAYDELVHGADIVVADGMPLVWAARLAGTTLPERVPGSTLCFELAAAAADAGLSIYLLGGNKGAADRAAERLASRFPGLRIAGWECPPFGFERDVDNTAGVRTAVAEARPDIVLVALGSPKQERLIRDFRASGDPRLERAWWLGVGISLSFIAGEINRAPPVIQRLGLEWLHRFAQEPRRLARRYLVDGIPFAIFLLAASFMRRFSRRCNGWRSRTS